MTAELHRKLAMEAVYATDTWKACWPIWEPKILALTSSLADPEQVFDLGSQLKEVFSVTSSGSRSQSSLSGGGTGWECLVCWYLNLVLSGTNGVAMRQSRKVFPRPLRDATTVSYGTTQTNTEADICVVIYPPGFKFPGPGRGFMGALDKSVSVSISDIELGVVQCKTNWNDNAQIPMLWDMVYRASFGAGTHVTIGKSGVTIKNLKKFTYAFVTVPTQTTDFKPSTMAVKRVNNLSGGNYWGRPTKAGVALSLSEIFTKNYGSAFTGTVKDSISKAIKSKIGLFSP